MPDWCFHTLAVIVGVSGPWGLWWSLLRDCSRGRARCNTCWYDLTALAGAGPDSRPPTCPECGRAAKSVRQLYRTRRRWGVALLGVLALIAAPVLAMWPSVSRNGFWGAMPTTVLLWAEAIMRPGERSPLRDAFRDRFRAGGHAQWQWMWFYDRLLFDYRRTWPEGVAIVLPGFPMSVPAGKGRAASFEVLNGKPMETLEMREDMHPAHRVLPTQFWLLPQGSEALKMKVTFSDVPGVLDGAGAIPFDVPLTIGGTIDEVLPPAPGGSNPSVRAMCGKIELTRLPKSGRLAAVLSGQWSTSTPGLAVGMRLEVLREGRVVAFARWSSYRGFLAPAAIIEGDPQALLAADWADPAWTAVIRDDPELALRDVFATSRWVGSFEVPVPRLGSEAKP